MKICSYVLLKGHHILLTLKHNVIGCVDTGAQLPKTTLFNIKKIIQLHNCDYFNFILCDKLELIVKLIVKYVYQDTYVNFERKMKCIKIILLFLIQDCGDYQGPRGSGAFSRSLRDQWGLRMEVEDTLQSKRYFQNKFLKDRSYGKIHFKSGFIHLGLVLSLLLLTLLGGGEHKAL